MAIISQIQWDSIVQYIYNNIKGTEDKLYELQKLSYTNYIESQSKIRKVIMTREIEIAWKAWWKLWPSMRSFEYKGQKFVCNKPMKVGEEKMKEKWLIITEKEIGADWLYKAADNFLKSTMIDSVKKGRNEMEFVSGMLPWLNQKQWRNWLDVTLVDIVQEKKVYQNSTDM